MNWGCHLLFLCIFKKRSRFQTLRERVLVFFNWGEDKEPTTGWQRPRACSDPVWNLAIRGTVWSQWESPLWDISLSLSDLQCPWTRLQGSTAAFCSRQNNGKDGNHGKQRIAQPPGFIVEAQDSCWIPPKKKKGVPEMISWIFLPTSGLHFI